MNKKMCTFFVAAARDEARLHFSRDFYFRVLRSVEKHSARVCKRSNIEGYAGEMKS